MCFPSCQWGSKICEAVTGQAEQVEPVDSPLQHLIPARVQASDALAASSVWPGELFHLHEVSPSSEKAPEQIKHQSAESASNP